MRPTLLLTLLLATATTPTFAKGPKEKKTETLTNEEAFKSLDKDGDNLLSKEEFCAGTTEGKKSKKTKATSPAEEQFEKLDTDKDGKLTLEEFSKREAAPEGAERKKKSKAQE